MSGPNLAETEQQEIITGGAMSQPKQVNEDLPPRHKMRHKFAETCIIMDMFTWVREGFEPPTFGFEVNGSLSRTRTCDLVANSYPI